MSTLETSKRHVGEMSMCVFAVSGAYRPFPGKAASRRGCLLGRKGKVKAKRGFGVWSFVCIKKEEVNSECFRKKRAGKEGI